MVELNVILNGLQSASLELKVPYSQVKRMSSSNSFLLIGIAGSNSDPPKYDHLLIQTQSQYRISFDGMKLIEGLRVGTL